MGNGSASVAVEAGTTVKKWRQGIAVGANERGSVAVKDLAKSITVFALYARAYPRQLPLLCGLDVTHDIEALRAQEMAVDRSIVLERADTSKQVSMPDHECDTIGNFHPTLF